MRLQEIVDQRVEENKMLWFAQGSEQGFDKGSRDAKIATARNLLAMGMSTQQTAQAVGLALEDVETLV